MTSPLFDITENSTIFNLADNKQLSIDIGYQPVINNYFKQTFPTPYTTEIAIIVIEDTIEQIKPIWQPINKIVTSNKQIKYIASYFNSTQYLTIEQVELLFNRVADVIAGSPKREREFPDSIEFIATLLILREVLHHLTINVVELM